VDKSPRTVGASVPVVASAHRLRPRRWIGGNVRRSSGGAVYHGTAGWSRPSANCIVLSRVFLTQPRRTARFGGIRSCGPPLVDPLRRLCRYFPALLVPLVPTDPAPVPFVPGVPARTPVPLVPAVPGPTPVPLVPAVPAPAPVPAPPAAPAPAAPRTASAPSSSSSTAPAFTTSASRQCCRTRAR
jgi:hypothetical protein